MTNYTEHDYKGQLVRIHTEKGALRFIEVRDFAGWTDAAMFYAGDDFKKVWAWAEKLLLSKEPVGNADLIKRLRAAHAMAYRGSIHEACAEAADALEAAERDEKDMRELCDVMDSEANKEIARIRAALNLPPYSYKGGGPDVSDAVAELQAAREAAERVMEDAITDIRKLRDGRARLKLERWLARYATGQKGGDDDQ